MDEQTTLEVLRKARGLLSEPGCWIKHTMARDADGQGTGARSPDAACWCAWGAIMHSTSNELFADTAPILRLQRALPPGETVPGWNDDPKRTQAEVLAAFDQAIAMTEGLLKTPPDVMGD